MDSNFYIFADPDWLLRGNKNEHRLTQKLCPIGSSSGHLAAGCTLLVKFRSTDGTLVADGSARIEVLGTERYIKSDALASSFRERDFGERLVAFFFEGTKDDARCIVHEWTTDALASIDDLDRLALFELPPTKATMVDAEHLTSAFYEAASAMDRALFAAHADRFLDSPNIIAALFSHLMSVRTENSIGFPIKVKKIADQLRTELENRTTPPCIGKIEKSHLNLWSEVQGKRFAFLDAGAARIGALPHLSPMALRVGVYSVRPGIEPDRERESWSMRPFVVADLLDRIRRPTESPDRRRLQEAARYTLEAIGALLHVRDVPDTVALLTHGPLVNQFTMYDEDEPNFVPFLTPEFLSTIGIDSAAIEARIAGVPSDSNGPMWNQFMAVYGYVMLAIFDSPVPVIGVVERPTGRSITNAVLGELQKEGVFNAEYTRRVKEILEQYDITDDFLFGCMLREGEYVTPVRIEKNIPRKARPRWAPVVRQYPSPFSMLLKSEETNFPFRLELNPSAVAQADFLARFIYHTARLLPRYAFPVGLDIADKYAKIPDWLSRGISGEISASVLRRAMKTGNANLVTQLRLFLARGPRDFFYRPSAHF
jgi:hypothetical protein